MISTDAFKARLLRDPARRRASVEQVDRGLAWAQALKRTGYVARRARLRLLRAGDRLEPGDGHVPAA